MLDRGRVDDAAAVTQDRIGPLGIVRTGRDALPDLVEIRLVDLASWHVVQVLQERSQKAADRGVAYAPEVRQRGANAVFGRPARVGQLVGQLVSPNRVGWEPRGDQFAAQMMVQHDIGQVARVRPIDAQVGVHVDHWDRVDRGAETSAQVGGLVHCRLHSERCGGGSCLQWRSRNRNANVLAGISQRGCSGRAGVGISV